MVEYNDKAIYLNKMLLEDKVILKLEEIRSFDGKFGKMYILKGIGYINENGIYKQESKKYAVFISDTMKTFNLNSQRVLLKDYITNFVGKTIELSVKTYSTNTGRILKNYMVKEIQIDKPKKIEIKPKQQEQELQLNSDEQDIVKQLKDNGYTKADTSNILQYFAMINTNEERAKKIIEKYL